MRFFFNAPPPPQIYTLSLHDALPISLPPGGPRGRESSGGRRMGSVRARSEEHTSELQSPYDLVCRLLLEKKNHNDQEQRDRDLHALDGRPEIRLDTVDGHVHVGAREA